MVESKSEKARRGGLRRIELYGNPGTPDGRSKGGKSTIRLFHQNPTLANKLGFIIRKEIRYPVLCVELAELIGIILGDGGLPGNHQLTISFNRKTDRDYSLYIGRILKRLFSIDYHIYNRKDSNGAEIVVSSSNLIAFLMEQGLIVGNKVKNQIDIPEWINEKVEYQKACLRGLIDTDGSFYSHRYNSNGRNYDYLKLCFASRSKPLLNSVLRVLKKLNFDVYLHGVQLYIYSRSGIKKYYKEIGSHNPKHLNKLKSFLFN